MGCDIHIHAEIKVNGQWHHYDQPDCRRDYDLFEKMAGVRGEVKNAIAAPRGIPEDASFTTRFDCEHWDSDGHSHSWLGAAEIDALEKWDEARGQKRGIFDPTWDNYLFGNSYSGFTRYPNERPKNVQDVRFVFWFDN